MNSTIQPCQLILQDGDQPSKLALNHTATSLFRSSHLEMSLRLVGISISYDMNLIVTQTGEDTEMLRKVEALLQAEFKNGLPPHLQANAKSLSYLPGSGQSRIFVSSHSEFRNLHASVVQRILRERAILVHGNTFDYEYGWNLESFGRLYDVDKKTTVHGEI